MRFGSLKQQTYSTLLPDALSCLMGETALARPARDYRRPGGLALHRRVSPCVRIALRGSGRRISECYLEY